MPAPEVDVDCDRLDELLHPDEIVDINHVITDPDSFEEPRQLGEGDSVASLELGVSPEMDIGREEDYHQLNQPGIVETLVYEQLPYECRADNDALWLSCVIMSQLASSQAFYEGNKRTAYVIGVLFLIKAQLMAGEEEAIYPMLDKELTDTLSAVATLDMDREELYDYLTDRLSG
ncbi:MAG: hypothetical protein SV186_07205 [Candidatus Nanohaloarchaea archaeon]|nr:hypothetical protein [Candidatus Nanohaloarchaea archaeon]